MDFFPVDWYHEDVFPESGEPYFRLVTCGKTIDGMSVCAQVRFTPYFFVEVPSEWSDARTRLFIAETARKHNATPSKCVSLERKSAWGFAGGAKKKLVQLAFMTMRASRFARKALSREHQTYESSVDPLIRVFHLRKVSPAGWVHLSKHWAPRQRIANVDIEVETSFEWMGPSTETRQPPLVIASWDLEVYSESGKFPLSENTGDCIIQASTAFQKYGQADPYLRSVVCLNDTAPVEGVEIISVDGEHDLINAWIDLLTREKADVLIGYNTNQFDWKYIHGRSLVRVDDRTGEPLVRLSRLGRLIEGGGNVVERELNSSAYGQNKFFTLSTPGVMQIDLLQWFRKNRSHDSYSLGNISKAYLGDTKLDLPAHQIFAKFLGSAEDRADVARYAVRDTELPLRLLHKLAILEDLQEMANAVKVPVDFINNRGQQVRVFSALVGKAREMGFAIPDDKAITTSGKFEGATVLDAKKGAYFQPIAALDFASLYPSIMRSENLSFDTLVLDNRFGDLPGVEYVTIETGMGTFKFAQPGANGEHKGILPNLLDDLATYRKQAKKEMAAAKSRGDEWAYALYNAKQLAFKVTMNSAYGFCGASKGFLPMVPIAASVTATGRNMIAKTAQLALELVPGSEVVYGDTDSVMVRFNIEDPHDLKAQFQVATRVADNISKTFKAPHELEMEKIYYPYVLYSKKRYAAIKYEDPDEKGKMDVKGIALVRRDNAPILKSVLQECLDTILFRKDAESALQTAREHVRKVLDNAHDSLDPFVISKTLRTDYKVDSQPHVHVARRIQQRRGFPVPSGSRVPYVFIENPENPDQKQAAKAEDPEYAREHGLTIDRLYYIEHQLKEPLISLFAPIVEDPEAQIFGHASVKPQLEVLQQQFKDNLRVAKRVRKNAVAGQHEITRFFKFVPMR